MFDYIPVHWSAFFVAAVLLILSPGPTMAFILALIILGAKLTRYLNQNNQVTAWTDRGLDALFAGLGVGLAMSRRT